MGIGNDLEVTARLNADGSGLVGEFKKSKDSVDKFGKTTKKTGDAARKTSRDTEKLGRSARGVDREFGRAQRTVRGFDRALGALGIGSVVVGLGRATGAAASFENKMAEVSTLLDDMRGMPILTAQAQAQALAFGSIPGQQAAAQYQIISAGADNAAEAIATLTASNKLAVGGVTDVAVAADGLTSIMNAYGGAAGTATDISDTLFVGMRAGKTTIAELSRSMGQITPITAGLGISLEEITAALAAVTKGGIRTGVAVQGLRQFLSSVLKPSQEATDEAKRLGFQYDAAALQAMGLADFIKLVAEETGGSKESLALLTGGVEALIPVMALAGNQAEDFAQILADMANKAGATEAAVAKMSESAEFKLDQLKAAAILIGIDIGNALLTPIVPAAETIVANLDGIERGLTVLAAAVGTLVVFKTAAAAGLALAAVFGGIATGAEAATAALLLLKAGAGVLFGPAGLILAAAGGLAFLATRQTNAEKAAKDHAEALSLLGDAARALPADLAAADDALLQSTEKRLDLLRLTAEANAVNLRKDFGQLAGVGFLETFKIGAQTTADISALGAQLRDGKISADAYADAIIDIAIANPAFRETADELLDNVNLLKSAESDAKKYRQQLDAIGAGLAGLTPKFRPVRAAVTGTGNDAAISAEKLKKMQREAAGIFTATRTPLEALEAQLKKLRELLDEGLIDEDTFKRAGEQARLAFREAEEAARSSSDVIGIIWEDAAGDMRDVFVDGFDDILKDGEFSFKKLGKSIGSILRRSVAEIGGTLFTQKFAAPLLSQLSGGALNLGGASSAGGAGGVGGAGGGFNPFSLTGLLSLGQSTTLGGYGVSLANSLGFGASGQAAFGNAGLNAPWGIVGSLGANALGLGGGIGGTLGGLGGGLLGGALGGSSAVAGLLGSASFLGGPVGAILGSFLGTALGGLFGKKPTIRKAISPLGFDPVTGEVSSADSIVRRGGNVGLSEAGSNATADLLNEILGTFEGGITGLPGRVAIFSKNKDGKSNQIITEFQQGTGVGVNKIFDDTDQGFKDAISDLTFQTLKAAAKFTGTGAGATAATTAAAGASATPAGLSGLALAAYNAGYRPGQAAVSAASGQSVEAIADSGGRGALGLIGASDNVLSAIRKSVATDLEGLSSDIDFALFVDGLTDTADAVTQAEQAIKAINKTFDESADRAGALGISLDALEAARTRELAKLVTDFDTGIERLILGFTDPLQLALDQLTEAQENRLREAEALGADLVDVEKLNALERQQVLEQFGAATTEVLQTTLNDGLESLLNELLGGTTSPLAPDVVLANAEARFNTLRSAALGGDEEARGEITGAAKDLLDASQAMFRSSDLFFQRFDFVTATLNQLIGNAPGFAHGGSGVIAGSGPPDSRLFVAKVTPGEAYAFGDQALSGGGGGAIGELRQIARQVAMGTAMDELNTNRLVAAIDALADQQRALESEVALLLARQAA